MNKSAFSTDGDTIQQEKNNEQGLRYVVLVECSDELDQESIYNKLNSMGLKVKVLVG